MKKKQKFSREQAIVGAVIVIALVIIVSYGGGPQTIAPVVTPSPTPTPTCSEEECSGDSICFNNSCVPKSELTDEQLCETTGGEWLPPVGCVFSVNGDSLCEPPRCECPNETVWEKGEGCISEKYFTDEHYCEKDTDCVVQDTVCDWCHTYCVNNEHYQKIIPLPGEMPACPESLCPDEWEITLENGTKCTASAIGLSCSCVNNQCKTTIEESMRCGV